MKKHPLSSVWPEMSSDEKTELIADIKLNGVVEPVVVHDGMILDGWHRWNAARLAGRDCPLNDYLGSDPAGFVISRNARRRHLTKKEIALAVAKTREWASPGRPSLDALEGKKSVKEMAAEAGVSPATMRRAKEEIQSRKTPDAPPKSTAKKKTPPPAPPAKEGKKKSPSKPPAETPPPDKPKPAAARNAIKLAARDKTIAELEDKLEAANERIAMLTESASPDSAKREATLNSQREQIRALRAQVAEWQTKHRECQRKATALQRKLSAWTKAKTD